MNLSFRDLDPQVQRGWAQAVGTHGVSLQQAVAPLHYRKLYLSISSNAAASLLSFEVCNIWIGNREHPSTLLPLCRPCARRFL